MPGDVVDPAATRGDGRPVVNLVGERVALGPLSPTLLLLYQAWMNDFVTQAWAGYPPRPEPWSDERIADWYQRAATDPERMFFTIYEIAAWRAIGSCALVDIDFRHGTAEFGMTIGDPADRGHGFGTAAVMLLLDLAFLGLGLTNVQLRVFEFNHAGIAAYRRAGFTEIGRRRGSYSMGGRSWDEIYMDYRAEDFQSPVLGSLLAPGDGNTSPFPT